MPNYDKLCQKIHIFNPLCRNKMKKLKKISEATWLSFKIT
jgi:hypothetical protein